MGGKLRIECPACNFSGLIPAQFANKTIRCKKCNQSFPAVRIVRPAGVFELPTIDTSNCGLIAEMDLRPWSRGEKRTSDGVRERLACFLRIDSNSIAEIVDRLMVPVLAAHNEQLVKWIPELPQLTTTQIQAIAWLAVGAECRTGVGNASLFVLYFVQFHVKGDVLENMIPTLVEEINKIKPTFSGKLWKGYSQYDVVKEILQNPQPSEFCKNLMRKAVETYGNYLRQIDRDVITGL